MPWAWALTFPLGGSGGLLGHAGPWFDGWRAPGPAWCVDFTRLRQLSFPEAALLSWPQIDMWGRPACGWYLCEGSPTSQRWVPDQGGGRYRAVFLLAEATRPEVALSLCVF